MARGGGTKGGSLAKRGSGGKPAAGKTRGGGSGKSNPKDSSSSRKTAGSVQPATRLAGSNRGRGRGGAAAGRGGKAGAKSAKPAKPPAPAAAAGEEEDVELSDEDVAFFAQHQNFARFLSGLEEQQLGSETKGAKSKLPRPDRAENGSDADSSEDDEGEKEASGDDKGPEGSDASDDEDGDDVEEDDVEEDVTDEDEELAGEEEEDDEGVAEDTLMAGQEDEEEEEEKEMAEEEEEDEEEIEPVISDDEFDEDDEEDDEEEEEEGDFDDDDDDDEDIDEVMVFADSSAAGLGSLPQKGSKGKAGDARRADKGKGGAKRDGAEGEEEEEGGEGEGEEESEDEEAEYERGTRRPGWAAPAAAAGKFAPKPRGASAAASAGMGGDAEEVAVEGAPGAEGEKKGSMRGFGLIAARDKGVLVDAVDALPVKTLDGRLMYRAIEVPEGAEGETGEKGRDTAGEKEDGKKGRKGKKGEEGKGGPRGEEAEEEEEEEDEEKEAGARKQPKDASKLTLQEQAMMELQEEMSVEERRAAVKKAIARMSTQILADPEAHIGLLKSLHKLCLDADSFVASLAVLSLTAVFRDIIPGYRVRMRTEKERAMVMSKEVKKRWLFEEGLLQSYQSFVNLLLKHAKQAARRAVSVRAMCGLLRAAPHFNCRSDLIRAIIPRMDLADDSISSLCCSTISELMREDGRHDGEATVEAAELVADFIRQRCCVTRPLVLLVFETLEFDDDLLQSAEGRAAGGPRGGAKRKATWGAGGAGGAGGAADGEEQQPAKPKSKKERKLEKRKEAARMRKEVEGDFREAEAVRDESTRKQQQARVLAAVFEALFRVVKAAAMLHQPRPTDGSGALSLPPRPLLPSALFLIGHFSHLLSVEYLPDLLSTLRQLAADRVMKANLDSLNVDMRGFVTLVYQMILEAPIVPAQVASLSSESPPVKASSLKASSEEEDSLEEEVITPGGSAVASLEAALVSALQEVFMSSGHRQADMTRCAAFIKRLSAAALHLSAAGAVAVLLVVRHLLLRYPRCRVLLDKDPDDDLHASGGGLGPYGGLARYDPAAPEPELSAALTSFLWELSLLARHYHPHVASLARHAYAAYSSAVTESCFRPAVATPLAVKSGAAGAAARRQGSKAGNGKRGGKGTMKQPQQAKQPQQPQQQCSVEVLKQQKATGSAMGVAAKRAKQGAATA
ncbi:unnamed protein product [Closterium sp. Yama58-4]|nr:unnamed protein product [Closterium sp. Yama58-4]